MSQFANYPANYIYGNYHIEPSFYNFGNSGAAITLDLSRASSVKTVLNSATPAITLSNGQAGAAYLIMLVQDSGGGKVPSFVTSIDWGANGAPTLSTAANKIDFINLYTPDGTTWYGMSYSLGF